MQPLTIVFMAQNAACVFEVITGLNWIPAQMLPVLGGLLSCRFKRHWTRVKRQLHLPAKVVVVDHVGPVLHRSQKGDGTSAIQVHTEFDLIIRQPAHLLRQSCRGQETED